MKKTIFIILLIILVGCSNSNEVICSKEFNEEFKIARMITLKNSGNKIETVISVDEIYFDDVFTKEIFTDLEEEFVKRSETMANLTYTIEELEDKVVITSTISDFMTAQSSELSFIGMNPEILENQIGLKETIAANEANGFICAVVE